MMTANRTRLNASRRTTQKGAAMVELSLCFLLIFTLVYGLMEFSRVVYSYNILAGATREASRYAMVHGSKSGSVATASDIQTQVSRWAIGLDSSALTVNTTWIPGNTPGSSVRVESSYTLTPITSLIIGNSLTLSSRSEMVISQ
jgi:Flp pilus assembly protein TadG